MHDHLRLTLLSLIGVSVVTSGCVPVVAGGVASGTTVAMQERTFGTAIDDTTIAAKIKNKFIQKDTNSLFANVGVEVKEGRVLLTGAVKNPDTAVEAVRLTWEVQGVREVINEIQVSDQSGLNTLGNDSFITANIRSRLLLDKNVRSVNYNVETVRGVVYLMGIAQDQRELETVTTIARNTRGVNKVISHVVLKDDPRRQPQQ